MVRGNRGEKEAWQVFVDGAGLLVSFSSILSLCVHFVPFFLECVSLFISSVP